MWLGISKTTVHSLFVFPESMITDSIYLDMLTEFVESQLQQDGIVGSVVFQQDGAPLHYVLSVKKIP